MLAGREHVEAERLRLERDGDHRPDPLFLARRATCGGIGRDIADREDPELHLDSFRDGLATVDLWLGAHGGPLARTLHQV